MSESSVSPPATPPPTGPWTRQSLLGSLYLCIFILINTWLPYKSRLKSLLFFWKKKKIPYWILNKVLIPQLAFFVYHSLIPRGFITVGHALNKLMALFSTSWTSWQTHSSSGHHSGSAVKEVCTVYFDSRGARHPIHLENEWKEKFSLKRQLLVLSQGWVRIHPARKTDCVVLSIFPFCFR